MTIFEIITKILIAGVLGVIIFMLIEPLQNLFEIAFKGFYYGDDDD